MIDPGFSPLAPCNSLCAEFDMGHPNGPFCSTQYDDSEVARTAVQHQIRAAIVTLAGLDLDMRAWLDSEDECHRDTFIQTRSRILDALSDLESMSHSKESVQ